jgi:hypothetical protein
MDKVAWVTSVTQSGYFFLLYLRSCPQTEIIRTLA